MIDFKQWESMGEWIPDGEPQKNAIRVYQTDSGEVFSDTDREMSACEASDQQGDLCGAFIEMSMRIVHQIILRGRSQPGNEILGGCSAPISDGSWVFLGKTASKFVAFHVPACAAPQKCPACESLDLSLRMGATAVAGSIANN